MRRVELHPREGTTMTGSVTVITDNGTSVTYELNLLTERGAYIEETDTGFHVDLLPDD